MKIKHLLFSLLLGYTSLAFSQASIESIVGWSDNGLANQTTFSINVNSAKNLGIELGFYLNSNDYELEQEGITYDIPIDVFTINVGINKAINPLSSEKLISTFSLGASGGVEILNNGSKELLDGTKILSESGFVVGGYTGLTVAYKISSKFSAVCKSSYFHHFNSEIATSKFILGAGLRYNF